MVMLLVDHYLYLPGCCWSCRSVNLPTIDTGIDLDGVNSPDDPNPSAITRIYFCADCAMEMARMVANSRNMEISTAGSNQTLADTVQMLGENNSNLLARVDELENALRIVRSIPAATEEPAPPKAFKVATPKEVKK
jgi:hypothetical protein